MDKKYMSMEQLVYKAATGDQFAWSDLYNETFREAYFVAKKVVGNEEDAVELVQDAFITAFEKLNQLADKAKFQSWFNMIVANKCRDYLRKSKPLLFSEIAADDGGLPEWVDDRDYGQPEISLDKDETVHLVAEIIDTLPGDQKLCMILYYWDEQSVAQIANALEVSEGTVKSRLNYARKKVKAKVEELEKKGVKLYGIAPLPLLVWLLRVEANAIEIPTSAMMAPAVTVETVTATIAAEAGATTAATTTVGAGTKAVAAGLIGKVIAGVVAFSVVVGGIAVYNNKHDTPPISENIENQPHVDPAKEAFALYEELLSIGNTESGLRIAYYAYIDLNQDGIPELLVSDGAGTPDTMSSGEVYTYRNGECSLCSTISAYYDYFYYANEKYLMGSHRKGRQYIAIDEQINTTIYHWDETMTKNDPAISYNNGDWQYITKEEFDCYQAMPGEETSQRGFIESAKPIALEKNSTAQPNLIEKHLGYTDAWGFFASIDGNDQYFLSMVFNEYGRMDSVLSFAMDNQPIEPMGYYKGSYIAFKDTLTIQLGSDGNSYSYQFDPATFTLTQISESGIFKAHKIGDTFTLIKDE